MPLLSVEDIQAVMPDVDPDRAAAFIEDAEALALTVAPCLGESPLDPAKAAAAKAILRQVVLRWVQRGSGVTMTQQAGPFQVTYDNSHGGLFWPSEIVALQAVCSGGPTTGQVAFSVDMTPRCADVRGHWVSTTEFSPEG